MRQTKDPSVAGFITWPLRGSSHYLQMRNRRYWRFADLSDYEVVLFESLGDLMAGDGKQQVHDLIEQGAGGRP